MAATRRSPSPSPEDLRGMNMSPAPSDLSCFSKRVPNEVECFRVEIPRGLKFVGSTAMAAGHLKDAHRVPCRAYEVTVEPKGRIQKAREQMRAKSVMDSNFDVDIVLSARGEPSLDGAIDERSAFRNERLKRFEASKHFPALVSPRLVPSYRLSHAGQQSLGRGGRVSVSVASMAPSAGRAPSVARSAYSVATCRTAASVLDSTVSVRRKHRSKVPDDGRVPFCPGGVSKALISDRGPVLFDDHYDSPRDAARQDYQDGRVQWKGAQTILPTSLAESKASCAHGRQEIDETIADHRERGRHGNQALKDQHDARLLRYQQEDPEIASEARRRRPMALLKPSGRDDILIGAAKG